MSVDFNARLPPMPKLRLVHLPAAGLDTVDLAAVPEGCRVCNVFEHDIGVSEYVMAAMLYFTIGLVSKSERFVRQLGRQPARGSVVSGRSLPARRSA